MIYSKDQVLEYIKQLIKSGMITQTDKVYADSYVVFTETKPEGSALHAYKMRDLSKEIKESFLGKKRGYKIGLYKIIGAFDE